MHAAEVKHARCENEQHTCGDSRNTPKGSGWFKQDGKQQL
jgi:hypothetical protein